MQQLNLPEYHFKLKFVTGKKYIFDSIRKKYVLLTPEEWVRQNFIRYLAEEKKYPENLMAIEKKITLNRKTFRFDLLVYNRNGKPLLIAEFKAPEIRIAQETFDQVVRYNMALKVENVIVSNGLQHFSCAIDYSKNSYSFLRQIPEYRSQ